MIDTTPSPAAVEAGLAALYTTGAIDVSMLGAWTWVIKRVFAAMMETEIKQFQRADKINLQIAQKAAEIAGMYKSFDKALSLGILKVATDHVEGDRGVKE